MHNKLYFMMRWIRTKHK